MVATMHALTHAPSFHPFKQRYTDNINNSNGGGKNKTSFKRSFLGMENLLSMAWKKLYEPFFTDSIYLIRRCKFKKLLLTNKFPEVSGNHFLDL